MTVDPYAAIVVHPCAGIGQRIDTYNRVRMNDGAGNDLNRGLQNCGGGNKGIDTQHADKAVAVRTESLEQSAPSMQAAECTGLID